VAIDIVNPYQVAVSQFDDAAERSRALASDASYFTQAET